MIIIILIILLIGYFVFKPTIEGYVGDLRVANELDEKRAAKYALEKLCKEGGYQWVELGSEFSYDCRHTKETCEKESVYPTQQDSQPKYYEWRSPNSEDAKLMAERSINKNLSQTTSQQFNEFSKEMQTDVRHSSTQQNVSDILRSDTGGVCILGNEVFRDFCEENDLEYNKDTGECKTTRKYCASKTLPYCKEDCFQSPVDWLLTTIIGESTGRALAHFVSGSSALGAVSKASQAICAAAG